MQVIGEKEVERGLSLSLDKLDLTGCSFSKSSLQDFDEINKRKGSCLVLLGAFDDIEVTNRRVCGCFRCFYCI